MSELLSSYFIFWLQKWLAFVQRDSHHSVQDLQENYNAHFCSVMVDQLTRTLNMHVRNVTDGPMHAVLISGDECGFNFEDEQATSKLTVWFVSYKTMKGTRLDASIPVELTLSGSYLKVSNSKYNANVPTSNVWLYVTLLSLIQPYSEGADCYVFERYLYRNGKIIKIHSAVFSHYSRQWDETCGKNCQWKCNI